MIIIIRPENMKKFKELLENNHWLAIDIHRETGIMNATLSKYKGWVVPWFKNKVKIYEYLLDIKMIKWDTHIDDFF